MSQKAFPLTILSVFLCSLLYWSYLAVSTQMPIVFDSLSYEELGRTIQQKGFSTYFNGEPKREPLYPLLVAASMHAENWLGIDYTRVMAVFGVIILFTTQILLFFLMRLFGIRTGICALVLSYFALSPAFNNTAFSLYSEITTYPFILGIILITHQIRRNWTDNTSNTTLLSALLGILFACVTLVKAPFECIFPLYMLGLAVFLLYTTAQSNMFKKLTAVAMILTSSALMFYGPILSYKYQNWTHNQNFAITNRGSWALYGNTARRMEPLNPRKLMTALAYVPGEGLCHSLFGQEECDFWSFKKSDEFGFAMNNTLQKQSSSLEEINRRLISLSAKKALENPPQYALLTFFEGVKMFFWESTKIGFVDYPSWLSKLYDSSILKNALRLTVACITILAFLYCCMRLFRYREWILLPCLSLVLIYMSIFSFFFILTRYALPIAPLYLLCIGYALQKLWPEHKNKKATS